MRSAPNESTNTPGSGHHGSERVVLCIRVHTQEAVGVEVGQARRGHLGSEHGFAEVRATRTEGGRVRGVRGQWWNERRSGQPVVCDQGLDVVARHWCDHAPVEVHSEPAAQRRVPEEHLVLDHPPPNEQERDRKHGERGAPRRLRPRQQQHERRARCEPERMEERSRQHGDRENRNESRYPSRLGRFYHASGCISHAESSHRNRRSDTRR